MTTLHLRPRAGLWLVPAAATVVRLRGELDLGTRETVRERLQHALLRGTSLLILDLSGVSYGDAAGLGVVVDVQHHATIVVAKVFHQANGDPQRFRTFLREVRGMRLHDPHIGQILYSGQDRRSQAVYLISPLYQPGSLNLHLQQRPGAGVSLTWGLWVLDQVLAGLQAAAASNIIHLDIKPQNIVLDGLTNIRIIDWGMSQPHQAGKSVSTVVPGGTKWFTSPEQLGAADAAPQHSVRPVRRRRPGLLAADRPGAAAARARNRCRRGCRPAAGAPPDAIRHPA
jgi:serine/threonine protein kinase